MLAIYSTMQWNENFWSKSSCEISKKFTKFSSSNADVNYNKLHLKLVKIFELLYFWLPYSEQCLNWKTLEHQMNMSTNEDAKENNEGTKLLHCRFKSKKYKRNYKIFLLEKFINELKLFNNRHLTNALKLIEKIKDDNSQDMIMPPDWIVIKGIKEQYANKKIDEAWILSRDQLWSKIEAGIITRDLDKQLNLEEIKSEEFEMEHQIGDASHKN